MKTVRVEKDRLLAVLKENRETHEKDFEIAWEAFKKKAVQNLEAKLSAARDMTKDHLISLNVNLTVPQNHVDDYDRAIEMVDWEVDDVVDLEEYEFQQYVQDNWGWKNTVSSTNALYTGSASPSSIGKN